MDAKTTCFPGDSATADQRKSKLKIILQCPHLAKNDRLLAILHYRDDMDAKAIAHMMGLDVAVVRRHLMAIAEALSIGEGRVARESKIAAKARKLYRKSDKDLDIDPEVKMLRSY